MPATLAFGPAPGVATLGLVHVALVDVLLEPRVERPGLARGLAVEEHEVDLYVRAAIRRRIKPRANCRGRVLDRQFPWVAEGAGRDQRERDGGRTERSRHVKRALVAPCEQRPQVRLPPDVDGAFRPVRAHRVYDPPCRQVEAGSRDRFATFHTAGLVTCRLHAEGTGGTEDRGRRPSVRRETLVSGTDEGIDPHAGYVLANQRERHASPKGTAFEPHSCNARPRSPGCRSPGSRAYDRGGG